MIINRISTHKILIIICLLSIFVSLRVSGQGGMDNTHALQFSVGAVHYRLIDEGFTQSRLKRSGTSFSFLLSYEQNNTKSLFKTFIQYGSADVTIHKIEEQVRLYSILLDIMYAKKTLSYNFIRKKSTLYLGLKVSASDYLLLDEKENKNLTVTFNYTLDFTLTQLTKLNDKSNIGVELALPLFGFIKREASEAGSNPILEDNYEESIASLFFANTKASFINPFSRPRLNFKYTYQIGLKTDFVINYQFSYINIAKIPSVNLFDNGLMTGLIFKF